MGVLLQRCASSKSVKQWASFLSLQFPVCSLSHGDVQQKKIKNQCQLPFWHCFGQFAQLLVGDWCGGIVQATATIAILQRLPVWQRWMPVEGVLGTQTSPVLWFRVFANKLVPSRQTKEAFSKVLCASISIRSYFPCQQPLTTWLENTEVAWGLTEAQLTFPPFASRNFPCLAWSAW